MHVRDLVTLAGFIARYAPTLLVNEPHIDADATAESWAAMRCRLDRWQMALKKHAIHTETASRSQRKLQWQIVRPVLEEVFVTEIFTRVWTAFCIVKDRQLNQQELAPGALSAQLGHLEARRRTLELVVTGKGADTEDAVALNQLRRRSERWSDMLCASMIVQHDLFDLAFDNSRVRDFSVDFRESDGAESPMWRLVSASVSGAFQTGLAARSPNEALNEKISSTVLASLGLDGIDSFSSLKPAWITRMRKTADNAQAWIDELLHVDANVSISDAQ
ncbi:MAG: hypothetical protein NXI22_01650 [bacterium]|nr:hypothetical protein [bacterium]